MLTPLTEALGPYGASSEAVLPLDGPLSPRAQLAYADLLALRDPPDAVIHLDDAPLAYVLRATHAPIPPARILHLRRILAQRDDAPFLVVLEAARLTVYAIDLDRRPATDALWEAIGAHEDRASATLRRLHDRQPARTRAIHDLVHDLLTTAIEGLHAFHGIPRGDAIALAGRALFMRFLLDRSILSGHAVTEVCPPATDWPEVFATLDHLRATCRWIDHTFNGDFLPVPALDGDHAFLHLSAEAFELLGAIMRRKVRPVTGWEQLDLDLPPPIGWAELDFAHIPVGVLSQVYESQARQWDPARRQGESVYYTPRTIAEYMVREAFDRLERQLDAPPHRARVLDPAVGGGVFLVAVFRELCAAWHRHHHRWPTSRELRHILYTQIAGFDIQTDALSLTSLSLYLTVIELDHPPYCLADLRFDRPLRGTVLFDVADPDATPGAPMAGSLGPRVDAAHAGRYDLVIANPPWTSLRDRAGQRVIDTATAAIRPTVTARLGPERTAAFAIPDKVPDLPFVWRAMQWARPGGVLAFAVHGRLLFKTSPSGLRARADLFDALTVWGVLNGADLCFTPVWPGMIEPFCLLFADNAAPPASHVFHVASPYYEPGINDNGRLRIDPDAMQPIAPHRLTEAPWLLKALFRGTGLDVHLLGRLRSFELPSLADWWARARLASGDGYQRSSQRMDASHLIGRPHLTTADAIGLHIDPTQLSTFDIPRLHRTRKAAIYQGPLLLLRESALVDAGRVHVSDDGLVYNESFYGYSAHGHPEAPLLVRYLALLLTSRLFEWYNLVTGGKFGVERKVWHKLDVDTFPFMPLDHLDAARKAQITPLFDAFAAGRSNREAIDAWVLATYDLGARAAEVITDTLTMASPHQPAMNHAAGRPEPAMIEAFAARLRERLAPFVAVDVRVIPTAPEDPYRALVITSDPSEDDARNATAQRIMQTADRIGSSEYILTDDATGRIWLGRLAQRRYWTASRARLTAARLLDEHLGDR